MDNDDNGTKQTNPIAGARQISGNYIIDHDYVYCNAQQNDNHDNNIVMNSDKFFLQYYCILHCVCDFRILIFCLFLNFKFIVQK